VADLDRSAGERRPIGTHAAITKAGVFRRRACVGPTRVRPFASVDGRARIGFFAGVDGIAGIKIVTCVDEFPSVLPAARV
jgi:hypothetical protein